MNKLEYAVCNNCLERGMIAQYVPDLQAWYCDGCGEEIRPYNDVLPENRPMRDKKLIQKLEALQTATTKLLDDLRRGVYQDDCNCGKFGGGCCVYHATTSNRLFDCERELIKEIARLKDGEERDGEK